MAYADATSPDLKRGTKRDAISLVKWLSILGGEEQVHRLI